VTFKSNVFCLHGLLKNQRAKPAKKKPRSVQKKQLEDLKQEIEMVILSFCVLNQNMKQFLWLHDDDMKFLVEWQMTWIWILINSIRTWAAPSTLHG